jgi:hypothetical protein
MSKKIKTTKTIKNKTSTMNAGPLDLNFLEMLADRMVKAAEGTSEPRNSVSAEQRTCPACGHELEMRPANLIAAPER